MPNYERPQETYHCQCAGCSNGMGSVFYDAPAEHFRRRGLSEPKNCHDCREYNKRIMGAGNYGCYCQYCTGLIVVSAKYIVSYHKSIGAWQDPTECSLCKRAGEDRVPRSAGKRFKLEKRRKPRQIKTNSFANIKAGIPVEPRFVSDDCNDYQNRVVAPDSTKETRQVHIAHHMPGSPHSLVGHNPFGRPKSPTAMVDPGVNDEQELLTAVSATFSVADSATMREYIEGNNIVRLTLLDDGRIEKTVIRPHPNQTDCFVVVTTYDNLEVAGLIEKYGRESS